MFIALKSKLLVSIRSLSMQALFGDLAMTNVISEWVCPVGLGFFIYLFIFVL